MSSSPSKSPTSSKSPSFAFKTGLLSPTVSSSHDNEFTKISAYKNTSIHAALTAKLQKARQSINEENDVPSAA